MWTKPASTEMRFGCELTMYVMNKKLFRTIQKKKPALAGFSLCGPDVEVGI